MTDSAILYDSSRCSACKGCQSACKCWNGLPSPLGKEAGGCTGSYQSPLELNGDTRLLISFNEKRNEKGGIEWAFARRSCMHCVNPACAAVCPSGTLHVDEASGMVAVSDEKCIGCQYCASACPFGVPHHYGPEPTVNKCTGCVDRIEQGRVPACVKTCQPGALNFGDRAEMLAIAHERVALLKSKGFDKAVVYGEDELDGLHVVSVAKYGLDAAGLPENPQVNDIVDWLGIMKPLTGIGAGAILAGLGLSFLTGVGYKRHTLHYDEVAHDVVDMDTGEVLQHIDVDIDVERKA